MTKRLKGKPREERIAPGIEDDGVGGEGEVFLL
jgi:hypothetical protein